MNSFVRPDRSTSIFITNHDSKQGKRFPRLANDAGLQGWMVSILTLGAMFGAFANGPVADRFSRRWSILYANIIFLIGSAIQAGAQDMPMMFISRFITGVSIGMLSMVVPLYLSEVAPPELRGSLVALQQLAITCGIMCAFWLDYGTQYIGGTGDGQSEAAWRFPLAFQCVPSLLLAVGTFFLPYSPRWLVQAGSSTSHHSFDFALLSPRLITSCVQIAKKKRAMSFVGYVVCRNQIHEFVLNSWRLKQPACLNRRQELQSTQTLAGRFKSPFESIKIFLFFAISTAVF